ncbi:hypothetical protein K438DRAFT_1781286 [Mycena galopus ATCC 62051]|nr:hypothetical protein K438DRAFT_1781286 [Mycena galopus ATCC 62051]
MGGTKGWTSDAGWGCILRTSQSLLATALERVGAVSAQPRNSFFGFRKSRFVSFSRLGVVVAYQTREFILLCFLGVGGAGGLALNGEGALWSGYSHPRLGTSRKPPLQPTSPPPFPALSPSAHALLARLLSWFLGTRAAPFGLHCMAPAGKDVDMWFGPSAAAGALRMLVDAFPACGVSVATDGTLPNRSAGEIGWCYGCLVSGSDWMAAFTPSLNPSASRAAAPRPHTTSSASKATVSYLDPHHSRPAVPFRPFVSEPSLSITRSSSSYGQGHGNPTSPSMTPGSRHSLSPEAAFNESRARVWLLRRLYEPQLSARARTGSLANDGGRARHRPARVSSPSTDSHNAGAGAHPAGGPMGAVEEAYFARAYSAAEMRTFHCEWVHKMPLSGLDPSMLIGFVVRDEADWVDLRRLPRTIFMIQDKPPTWPGADDDSDAGPDDRAGPYRFRRRRHLERASHASSTSASHSLSSTASTFSHTHAHHGSNTTTHSASTSNSSGVRSEKVDTEEDPVAPITPLPTTTRFDLTPQQSATTKGRSGKTVGEAHAELQEEGNGEDEDEFFDAGGEVEDIEDDWVDPVAPPPLPPMAKMMSSKEKGASSSGKDKSGSKEKSRSGSGKGKKKKVAPVPSVHYPFPVSAEDGAGAGATTPQQEKEQERERNVTA